ncbi:MAG: PfkB family carbohydrate kinase [Acidobacteriota bacterium]|jgi:D-glycero-beta-D-manno-heptose-7-phosphate kinase
MKERWADLAELVGRFAGKRVAVVGDFVLDRFWYGVVRRVSREAPVPILQLKETRLLPGCAANTVLNLSALGGVPVPVGLVGRDTEGDALLACFQERGIACDGIVRDGQWLTPTKTRVLAGSLHGPKQQLVRVDAGEENEIPPAVVDRVRRTAEKTLKSVDAVIISDYGYGLVQAARAGELAAGHPLSAVDSRFGLDGFSGLTTATPNEEEFEAACGDHLNDEVSRLVALGESLRSRLSLEALLVTRGSKGMSLFEKGRSPLHLPIVGSDQVVDVTGAGDTVISAYMLALAAGAGFPEAAQIADVAAGIVVEKHGPATTSREEIIQRLRAWGEGRIS